MAFIRHKTKRVFIIGAGFTKGACESAPLGGNLLSALECYFDDVVKSSEQRSMVDSLATLTKGRAASCNFRNIVTKFQKLFIPSLLSETDEPENSFSRISQEEDVELILTILALNKEILRRSEIAYSDLSEIEFNYFLNWSIKRRLGPAEVIDEKQVAEQFCQNKLEDGDTIITFNYDLLLDQALYKTEFWSPVHKKNRTYYCGYSNMQNELYFQNRSFMEPIKLFGNYAKICYVKLHGSINWYFPATQRGRATLLDDGYRLAKLYNFDKSGVSYFDESNALHNSWQFHNNVNELSIIKPTIAKEYAKQPYSDLVKIAFDEVSKADEIYLVGYSLPSYDTIAELIVLNTNQNCRLTIVNKGESAQSLKEKIDCSRRLRLQPVEVYPKGIEEWVK